MLQDNLLKIAEKYQESLIDDGLENYLNDDDKAVISVFKSILRDYKKMMKKCKKEGVDVGDVITEIEFVENEFKDSETKYEKQNLISRMKDRIVCLIEICDDVPKNISKKYCKDLFDLFENK